MDSCFNAFHRTSPWLYRTSVTPEIKIFMSYTYIVQGSINDSQVYKLKPCTYNVIIHVHVYLHTHTSIHNACTYKIITIQLLSYTRAYIHTVYTRKHTHSVHTHTHTQTIEIGVHEIHSRMHLYSSLTYTL